MIDNLVRALTANRWHKKSPLQKQCAYQKKHNYIITRKVAFCQARKKEKMDSFIIYFSLIAIMYVLILPFVGKRGKLEHTEEVPTPVYSEHFPHEESQIAYNRMHGLPDDAI